MLGCESFTIEELTANNYYFHKLFHAFYTHAFPPEKVKFINQFNMADCAVANIDSYKLLETIYLLNDPLNERRKSQAKNHLVNHILNW